MRCVQGDQRVERVRQYVLSRQKVVHDVLNGLHPKWRIHPWLARDCHVSATVIDFNRLAAEPFAHMGLAPNVQARARRTYLNVRATSCRHDFGCPRFKRAIGKALVQVNAGNAIAIEHKSETTTASSLRRQIK